MRSIVKNIKIIYILLEMIMNIVKIKIVQRIAHINIVTVLRNKNFYIGRKRKNKKKRRIVEICWKIVWVHLDCMMIIILVKLVGIKLLKIIYDTCDRKENKLIMIYILIILVYIIIILN